MNPNNIRWFNPRQMDDAAVATLACGRETLMANFLQAVALRLAHRGADKHWLVTGPRGAGKSFFLRMAQVALEKEHQANEAWRGKLRYLLLPEELPNVRFPHQFLDEIRRMLPATVTLNLALAVPASTVAQAQAGMSAFRVADAAAAWQASLVALLAAYPEDLLVVGIENLTDLLDKAFATDANASLLRSLMAHEPRLFLLATAVNSGADQQYNKRLFSQFEHHPLNAWDGAVHQRYLQVRGQQTQRQPSHQQLASINAYSRFTGGNARIAAIFADVILNANDPKDAAETATATRASKTAKTSKKDKKQSDSPLAAVTEAADTFNQTLDWLSDYYRGQLRDMGETASLVVDALLRGGEPCSQTELAERLGAKQSDLAQAFRALQNAGHLLAERESGEKQTRYRLADRLFAQWYRMRYLEPNKRSSLAVMAELLADTMSYSNKWCFASELHGTGMEDDAELLAGMALGDAGIQLANLKARGLSAGDLIGVGEWLARPTQYDDGKAEFQLTLFIEMLERWPSDAALIDAIEKAHSVLSSRTRLGETKVDGAEIGDLVLGSMAFSPIERLWVLQGASRKDFSMSQWCEIKKVLSSEIAAFDRLISTESETIEGLRIKKLASDTIPLAFSWMALSQHLETKNPEFGGWSDLDCDLLLIATQSMALIHATRAKLVNESDAVGRDLGKSINSFEYKNNCRLLAIKALQSLKRLLSDIGITPNAAHIPIGRAIVEIHGRLANALNMEGDTSGAADQVLNEAFDCLVKLNDDRFQEWFAERKTVALCLMGKRSEARDWAWTAYQFRQRQKSENANSWALGQAARHTAIIDGLPAALTLLDRETTDFNEDNSCTAWQQVADAITDTEIAGDTPAAFALGRSLLLHLAQQASLPFERLMRIVVIDLVEMETSLQLITELLQEVPSICSDAQFDRIAATHGLLLAWVADLGLTVAARTQARKMQNPDLAVTLSALEKELSMRTQVRLGLTEQPQPSAAAMVLFERILAMMHR